MDAGESEWIFDKPEAEPTDIAEAHATAEPTEQAEAHEPAAAEPAAERADILESRARIERLERELRAERARLAMLESPAPLAELGAEALDHAAPVLETVQQTCDPPAEVCAARAPIAATQPPSNSRTRSPRVGGSGKSRHRRCGVCGPCLANDCGSCRYCLDSPLRGGPNITKQICKNRRCEYLKSLRAESHGKRPKLAATEEEKASEPAAQSAATEDERACSGARCRQPLPLKPPRVRRIKPLSLAREGYSTPSGPCAPPVGAMIVVKFGPEWYIGRVISSAGSQARAVYEDGTEEDISFPDGEVRVVVPEKAATVMMPSIAAPVAPAAPAAPAEHTASVAPAAAAAPAEHTASVAPAASAAPAEHPTASDSDSDDDKLISMFSDNDTAAQAKPDAAAAAAKGKLTQKSKKRKAEEDRGEEAKPRKRARVYALAADGSLIERVIDVEQWEAPPTTKILTASLNDTDAIEFDQEVPASSSSASQGWARFAGFRSAQTVGEALALGAKKTDITYHLGRGTARFVVS